METARIGLASCPFRFKPPFVTIASVDRKSAKAAMSFWEYFENEAAPKLGVRVDTFRATFRYLDTIADRSIGIVETGCVRDPDNWGGDGQSTILFDQYAQSRPGSCVYTVDLDPSAVAACKTLVSEVVRTHIGDSVGFLASLVRERPAELSTVDLLYLDLIDVDMFAPQVSATHHLKELLAIAPLLSPSTLVVVDDSPSMLLGYVNTNQFRAFNRAPKIGGKAMFIAEYAEAIGVKPCFTGYQSGWIGLGR